MRIGSPAVSATDLGGVNAEASCAEPARQAPPAREHAVERARQRAPPRALEQLWRERERPGHEQVAVAHAPGAARARPVPAHAAQGREEGELAGEVRAEMALLHGE